ncbi:MAG: hypothetical protein GWO79_00155 [Actinobacteria bacterium]|nr:hypothetical protein [Actinomycetota bacterium]
MFDYLRKYNNLSKELRDKVSTPAVMSAIEELENKYGVNLAAAVMKVMIRDINDMIRYFMEEFKLSEERSRALSDELKKKVFVNVVDYLDIKQAVKEESSYASREDGNQPIIAKANKESPASSARHSGFYLSAEDEKEIKDLTQKVDGYVKSSSRPVQAEENIDKIIGKARINFGSETLAERFRSILKTYLRGIRDRLETKQTLEKPVESGGLGIGEESARDVLSIADGSLEKSEKDIIVEKPKKINVEEDRISDIEFRTSDFGKNVGRGDVGYDFVSEGKIRKPSGTLDTARELAPPAPSIVEKPAVKSQKTNFEEQADAPPPVKREESFKKSDKSAARKFFKTKEETLKSSNLQYPQGIQKPAAKHSIQSPQPQVFGKSEQGGKIKMEDVKFQPKIMGPIDELRYMQLIDFRRLNEDPFKAMEKIKEKISLLDDEYSKKLEGIKAWRLSPVNRLYLKMGEASISHKKPIDAIIEERKSAGKDYLNNREFEAIINLNRALRF